MSEKPTLLTRLGPFLAALVIIVADQVTKALVVHFVSMGDVGWNWGGDFFYLTHQRNTGVAFSMGHGLPDPVRQVLFIAVPLVVLGILGVYTWKDRTLTTLQRWSMGLILGGGLGNIIDRIFRPEGVVDFLSFKFYGILGMDRFATFNVADSGVTVGGALIILSLMLGRKRK